MGLGGIHLRRRRFNLLLLADALQGFEMLLRGLGLAARLDVRYLGIVDQLAREGALLEELLAAFEDFFRGVHGLFAGLRVGLRFHNLLGNGRGGGAAVVGFSLVELPPAFLSRGGQVAIFEHGQQLSLAHMIATIHVEAAHGGADLRHHRSLISRIENSIGLNHAADGFGPHFGGLHGGYRLGFLFLFLRASYGHKQQQSWHKRWGADPQISPHFKTPPSMSVTPQGPRDTLPGRRRKRCAPEPGWSGHPPLPARLLRRPGTEAGSAANSPRRDRPSGGENRPARWPPALPDRKYPD